MEQPGQHLGTALLGLTDLMDLWLIEWALPLRTWQPSLYKSHFCDFLFFILFLDLPPFPWWFLLCATWSRARELSQNLHQTHSRILDLATGSQSWLHIGTMGYGKLRKDINTWASLQRFWLQQVLSFKFPGYIRWYQGILLLIVLGVIKA